MRSAFHPRHVLSAAVALGGFVVLTSTALTVLAQSPALSFDAVEGEVWQQLPPVRIALVTDQLQISNDPFFAPQA